MSAAITITWPPCKAFPRGGTETYEIVDYRTYRVCSSGVLCDMNVADPPDACSFHRMDNSAWFLHFCDTQRLMNEAVAAGVKAATDAAGDRWSLLQRFADAVRIHTGFYNEYPRVAKV